MQNSERAASLAAITEETVAAMLGADASITTLAESGAPAPEADKGIEPTPSSHETSQPAPTPALPRMTRSRSASQAIASQAPSAEPLAIRADGSSGRAGSSAPSGSSTPSGRTSPRVTRASSAESGTGAERKSSLTGGSRLAARLVTALGRISSKEGGLVAGHVAGAPSSELAVAEDTPAARAVRACACALATARELRRALVETLRSDLAALATAQGVLEEHANAAGASGGARNGALDAAPTVRGDSARGEWPSGGEGGGEARRGGDDGARRSGPRRDGSAVHAHALLLEGGQMRRLELPLLLRLLLCSRGRDTLVRLNPFLRPRDVTLCETLLVTLTLRTSRAEHARRSIRLVDHLIEQLHAAASAADARALMAGGSGIGGGGIGGSGIGGGGIGGGGIGGIGGGAKRESGGGQRATQDAKTAVDKTGAHATGLRELLTDASSALATSLEQRRHRTWRVRLGEHANRAPSPPLPLSPYPPTPYSPTATPPAGVTPAATASTASTAVPRPSAPVGFGLTGPELERLCTPVLTLPEDLP